MRKMTFADTGQRKVRDDQLPGFGVIVGKRTKTFFVMTGNDRKTKTIGRYPEMTLSDARRQAMRILSGENRPKLDMALSEALSLYYEDCATRLRPGSLIEYQRHLKKVADKPLSKIVRGDIDVGDGHAVNAWRVFMNWCVRNELVEKNPFLHIPVKYGKRDRVLTSDEIRAVWNYEHPVYSDVVKLLLLTGQRRSEISKMQPSWVKDDTVTIPGDIAKNHKTHTYPFGELARPYIEKAPFTFNNWQRAQEKMIDRLGVEKFVLHDLRRTFATIHVEIGTPVHVTEALLNHSSGAISGIAAIYIRANLLANMRQAALRYEAHLGELLCMPSD